MLLKQKHILNTMNKLKKESYENELSGDKKAQDKLFGKHQLS